MFSQITFLSLRIQQIEFCSQMQKNSRIFPKIFFFQILNIAMKISAYLQPEMKKLTRLKFWFDFCSYFSLVDQWSFDHEKPSSSSSSSSSFFSSVGTWVVHLASRNQFSSWVCGNRKWSCCSYCCCLSKDEILVVFVKQQNATAPSASPQLNVTL